MSLMSKCASITNVCHTLMEFSSSVRNPRYWKCHSVVRKYRRSQRQISDTF